MVHEFHAYRRRWLALVNKLSTGDTPRKLASFFVDGTVEVGYIGYSAAYSTAAPTLHFGSGLGLGRVRSALNYERSSTARRSRQNAPLPDGM